MHTSSFLNIIGITKQFGSHQALKGITFSLMRGEIFSLLGINGAGKTTLSSILATLIPPTNGDIQLEGVSIYNDIPHFRRIIGYCPQRPNLNPYLTVRENLYFAGRYYGMSKEEINTRIEQVSADLSLHSYLESLPADLSGGYKQRATIARSLIHNPRLVIFDEPTVALDPQIRYKLWEIINQLKEAGITILLTTHYIEEAEALSDRVCVLAHGKVQMIDTPANLMKSFQKGKLEEVFIQLTQEEPAV